MFKALRVQDCASQGLSHCAGFEKKAESITGSRVDVSCGPVVGVTLTSVTGLWIRELQQKKMANEFRKESYSAIPDPSVKTDFNMILHAMVSILCSKPR